MISSSYIQNSYVKLYKELRKYIWGKDVVEDIADFEIEAYQTFPDKEKLQLYFNKLKRDVSSYIDETEDEDLFEAFDEIQDDLNEANDMYALLDTRQEV